LRVATYLLHMDTKKAGSVCTSNLIKPNVMAGAWQRCVRLEHF